MAARDASIGYDQLHHFIASGVWDAAPLAAALLAEADRLVGGDDAWLIVDDTALPKKGTRSVGVAPQYASALGKNANCQTLVSLTLASGEVPVMVGLRLFLPESWTSDPVRMSRAGVPEDRRAYPTEPEIALEEIDRARAAGLRFGCVLADAGYGLSAPFRQGLSERSLAWTVGIPFKQKVYPVGVAMIFPVAGRGRPRKRHVPDAPSVMAQAMLETAVWRQVSWRRGTKGRLSARFAAMRVRVADGPPQRIGAMGAQHLPGEEVWLIGELRSSGERKSLSSPTFPPTLRSSALPARSRLMDLRASPPATEGGTGPRPFRGAVMDRTAPTRAHDDDRICLPAIAPSRSGETGRKKSTAHRPTPSLPAVRAAIIAAFARPPPVRCPHCRHTLLTDNLPK